MIGTCASSLWRHIRSTRFVASTEEPETDRTVLSKARLRDSLNRQGAVLTWSGTSQRDAHMPHVTRKVRRNRELLQSLENQKNETLWNRRAVVGLRDLWKTGR